MAFADEAVEAFADLEKVVSILQRSADDDAGERLEILAIIHKLLVTDAPPARQAPSAFLAVQLLPQLVRLLDCSSPPGHGAGITRDMVAVTDAVSNVICALLQPAVDSYLRSMELDQEVHASASTLTDWAPVLTILLGTNPANREQHMSWLSAAATSLFTNADTNEIIMHHNLTDSVTGGPASLPSLPGGSAMLAVGSIGLLQHALICATAPSLLAPRPADRLAWQQIARKLTLYLEVDGRRMPLPSGAVSNVLFTLLLESHGAICRQLLSTREAVAALARPLKELAVNPSAWQEGPYAYHVQVLGYLCQWTASTEGLAGIQELAMTLASSAASALDALLRLADDVQRKGAACLVRNCLVLLTHLASSARGKYLVSRAEHMPEWLELAQLWKSQPAVLQYLALLARALMVDHAIDPYFSPLFRGKRWCFDLVAVPTYGADAVPFRWTAEMCRRIAAIMQDTLDSTTRALLVDLLARISEEAAGIGACQPAGRALLATAKSSASSAAAYRSARKASSDLHSFVVTVGLVGAASQQQALAAAIACCQVSRDFGTFHWLQNRDRDLGTPSLSKPDVMWAALAWLAVFSDGREAAAMDAAARLIFLHNMEGLLAFHMVPTRIIVDHQVLERCLRLLPHLSSDEECQQALRVVERIAATCQRLKHEMVDPTFVDRALLVRFSSPSTLDTLLQYFSGELQGHCPAAPCWPFPGVPVPGVGQEEDAHGLAGMASPLGLLLKVAAQWARFMGTYQEALQAVLCCTRMWDNIERIMFGMRARSRGASLHVKYAALDFLHAVAMRDAPKRLVAIAENRLEYLHQREKALDAPDLLPRQADSDDDCTDEILDDVLRPIGPDDTRASGSGPGKLTELAPGLARQSSGAAVCGSDEAAGGDDAPAAGGEGQECSACHKAAERLLSCARCGVTQYCSKECQQRDWKQRHKLHCRGGQRP